jgi:hypothetical protein
MVSTRSIWIGQRVITNHGETGTVISTGWSEDPDSGEDMISPIATIELDDGEYTGETVERFIRDIQLVALDGEDA